ncbi:MAG TPA: glycosyltransferase family 2 protein [Dehalococcoidia bacterium]|nr:glycosyltransferase family 2 protein [Dehalococcoidia bacterium]
MSRSRYWWIPEPLKPHLRRLRDHLHRAGVPLPRAVQPADPAFRCAIDPIPETIGVGRGSVLLITGYCFHLRRKLKRVEIELNGVRHPVNAQGMPRSDIRDEFMARAASPELPFYSGFWAIVPLPGTEQPMSMTINVVGRFAGGARRTLHVGTHTLTRRAPDAPQPLTPADFGLEQAPSVVICMATYNPPMELFEAQIRSIQAQTYDDWVCIISDDCSRPDLYVKIQRIVRNDKRFLLLRNSSNLGYYYNFERCLAYVPADARFIAMADQDDKWYPWKLAALIERFRPGVMLAYSDMRIVNRDGKVLAPSYWMRRGNNFRDLPRLVLENCITGAASMFRRELLANALPFPPKVGSIFHDHWLGCAALAGGRIAYVARPLYDYVQHDENVIGVWNAPAHARRSFWLEFGAHRQTAAISRLLPVDDHRNDHAVVAGWRQVYFSDLLPREVMAHILLTRFASRLSGRTRGALRRLIALETKRTGAAWLVWQTLIWSVHRGGRTGAEMQLLKGVLWKRSAAQTDSYIQPVLDTGVVAGDLGGPLGERARWIRGKMKPLALRVHRRAARRINILVQMLNSSYFYGGYITVGGLAVALAGEGYSVRIVALEAAGEVPASERRKIESFSGLSELFSRVEVVQMLGRTEPLDASDGDLFIATSTWTAWVAHAAAQRLGKENFLFLVQEYEPLFHAAGALSAFTRSAYALPHRAIFSTALLRDYFMRRRIGVFCRGPEYGMEHSMLMLNPVTDVGTVSHEPLRRRSSRRVLVYARPEQHAERNMFELAVLGLSAAIDRGVFDRSWEFFGVGKQDGPGRLRLAGGRELHLVPRLDQDAYRDLLREHDVGLSLMDTPHPSLVPIEMATAGMLVVTSTFANKTAAALAEISANLIGVEPTVDCIVSGLAVAVRRVDDIDARVAGAQLDWPRSAAAAFDASFMAGFERLLSISDMAVAN